MTALVGSEGGWSDEEIEQRRARDFHVVTLGGRILRAETAAIAVTALLQHLFGDLEYDCLEAHATDFSARLSLRLSSWHDSDLYELTMPIAGSKCSHNAEQRM